MKKFLCFLFFISFSSHAAYEAVCVVLEAPMLLKPSLTAKVSQVLRKGEKVRIRGRNVGTGPNDISYYSEVDDPYYPKDDQGNEYLEAVDSAARTVYIPKKYMRIIYQDNREQGTSINEDPTDYRVFEPIDSGYPFYRYQQRKLYWTYGLGSTYQTNYRYPRQILRESISSRHQLDVAFVKKVKDDQLNRFYFGGYIHLYGDASTYTLKDDVTAKEARGQFGIGPTLSYEFFRRETFGMTFWSALTVNYDRLFITQTQDGRSEERLFQGFSFTPKFGTFAQVKNVFPFGDLTMGLQMQINPAYDLKSSSNIEFEDLWRPEADTYEYQFGGIFTFYIGILTSV
jgi:hypothetical protein